MKREEFSVLSSADGLSLKGVVFMPEKIKGILLIAHGMCEHKERYFEFAEYMAEYGFACGIYDHRGHGESIRQENDLGYFYRDGRKAIVSDLHDVVRYMKEHCERASRNVPFFLLGHSMGSMVVRSYLRKRDEELDGLLVVGSPSKRGGVFMAKVLVRVLQLMKGGHSHSKLLDFLAVNSPYESRFAKEKLKHSWICTDKSVVDAYNQDPKCNFTFTINGYKVLFSLMGKTYGKRGYEVDNSKLPIMFFAGSEDPCIRNEVCYEKAMANLRKKGYKNVDGKLYQGMRHEILNEVGKEQVYEDMKNWLEKQTAAYTK